MRNQRGDIDDFGLITIAVIVLAVLGGIVALRALFGGEREGTAKYDDCREVITVKEDSWEKYLHKFTCTYRRTQSGKIMGGECVSIVDNSSLFSSSTACEKAYIYQKKQADGCSNPKNPYLGYDDMCHSDPQY